MKVQFSLVVLFFSNVVPLLGSTVVEDKLKKAQDFTTKSGIVPETRLVHTENVTFSSVELVTAWNKVFTDKTIAVPTASHEIEVVDLAVPLGEKWACDKLVSLFAKLKGKCDDIIAGYKAKIEEAAGKSTKVALKEHEFNASLGYNGYQNIYFIQTEKTDVLGLLKNNFPGIYGLQTSVTADKADFSDAIKTVFGETGNLIFEKIACDPRKGNLHNLEEHLKEVSKDPIKETETDPKLKALKAAIDAYATATTPVNLEKIKEEWLKQLKGNSTFPVTEESNKPKTKEAITPVTSSPLKSKEGSTKLNKNLAEVDENEEKTDKNLIEPKEEPTEKKKSSFPTWAIWLLGVLSFAVVGGIAFALIKRKSNKI